MRNERKKQLRIIAALARKGNIVEYVAIAPPSIGPNICPMLIYEELSPSIVPCERSSVSRDKMVFMSGPIIEFGILIMTIETTNMVNERKVNITRKPNATVSMALENVRFMPNRFERGSTNKSWLIRPKTPNIVYRIDTLVADKRSTFMR